MNPEDKVIDAIDELVDWQLARGERASYGVLMVDGEPWYPDPDGVEGFRNEIYRALMAENSRGVWEGC